MARTEGCVIFRERSRESFKHHIKKSQFKTFKEEDDEFAATLRKEESLDHNNCTWLSFSGTSSPSSCFQDNGFFCYTDLKIDAWFISLLSNPSTKSGQILSTKATFFDGSIANPIEEASLVLDQRKQLEENLEEKEVVSWLANESSSVSSITDSSDDQSLFSSCYSSDYSSEVVDLEEIGTDKPLFWPSDWTSEWTSGDLFIMSPRKGTNKLDSDKSCNRRLLFGTQLPSRFRKAKKTSTKIAPLDNETDFEGITDAKGFNERGPTDTLTTTPAFWPSDCASEWGSDTKCEFFVMSPRKQVSNFSKSLKTSPDTLRVRALNGKMDLEKGCIRRLEFNSCMNTAEGEEVKPLTIKDISKNRILLEDLLLVDKLNVEAAIEEALGLDEFDGHVGLESEFNRDGFSLVEIF